MWFAQLKRNVVAIAAVLTASATIVLAPIEFDKRYAHADEVRELAQNQTDQIITIKKSVTQNQLNWLEYYNDKIRSLERERDRNPSQIQVINKELDDVKFRKQILEKSLVDQVDNRNSRERR